MGTYHDQYPYTMPQDEAVERVRALTDYWGARYGTRALWTGNRGNISGRVLGIKFKATFIIDPELMHGEMKVSFIAVKMGGRQYLKHKLDDYLNPEISLEQLRGRIPGPDQARVAQA